MKGTLAQLAHTTAPTVTGHLWNARAAVSTV